MGLSPAQRDARSSVQSAVAHFPPARPPTGWRQVPIKPPEDLPPFQPEAKALAEQNAKAALSLEARLSRYLSPPLFPVHLRDLPSVACHQIPSPPFDIGPFHIETSLVCHPGPTVGYRVEGDGGVVAYMCDHEPALCLHNGRWPGREWISGFDLAVGVDLLIHDAQYTDEEYERYLARLMQRFGGSAVVGGVFG